MRFLVTPDLTLPEQLALDEAWLEVRETGGEDACTTGGGADILRVWESQSYGVVVGLANAVDSEVDVSACEEAGIPILRRVSGGGTVLQGPGCLNYSVILGVEPDGPLDSVTAANAFVMKRIREALNPLVDGEIDIKGHTDLAIDGRKFSGNAQKRKRRAMLFHGTLLLDFDLGRISRFLRTPSKQPDYRGSRNHDAFVRNIGLSKDAVSQALRKEWNAVEEEDGFPSEEVARLVREKYTKDEWNLRR